MSFVPNSNFINCFFTGWLILLWCMNNDQLLEKFGKLIDQKLDPLDKRLDGIEKTQQEQGKRLDNTATKDDLKNVATKQDIYLINIPLFDRIV